MAVDPFTKEDMDGAPPGPENEKTPQQVADYWLGAIQSAEKRRKPYVVRGRQILKRYKNKRTLTTLGVPIANRRMNVLWSNVCTQKPVLFNNDPKANVSRRNKTKDPIGRVASIVLQNCLQNSLAMEDFAFVMGQVVEDRLLPGCGVAMVEYVPTVEKDQVGWQAAETRYIQWEDLLFSYARYWQEVTWVGYWVYLTRRECYDVALAGAQAEGMDEAKAKEFADDVWREITLDHKEKGEKTGEEGRMQSKEDGPAKARVCVVWDKTTKRIIQISPGYAKAPLATMAPPVNFDGFWPLPRPLQSTTTNDSTNPVPDFEQYVDQADEIDLMTQRIGVLSKALRLRGLYPSDMDSLKQLTEAGDADMIPYDQWQLIMERGGAEALVLWFPIEAVAKTLQYCIEARSNAIEIMYQVTGIADIMRGATEPSETATAQQLKAQFGGIRIRESQKDVQRFIRDILRLKAEVICEHFTLDVIKKMSGVNLLTEQEKKMVQQALQMWGQFEQAQKAAQQPPAPPQPGMPPPMPMAPPQPPGFPKPTEDMEDALKEPSWEQIMALLRDEKLRGFVVDVETDSTIEPDQQAQQQAASEFLAAVAQFMTAALPIMGADPDAGEMLGEMMAWATRQWKGADTIEGAVDEFVDKLKKKIQQAQENPPPPNPEIQVAQIKAGAEAAKAQASVQQVQTQAAAEQQKAQMDMIASQQDLKAQLIKLSAEVEAIQAKHAVNLEGIEAKAKAQRETANGSEA